jgi:hypothetical protein
MSTYLILAIFVMAFYLFLESLSAFCRMGGGLVDLCHKVKYVLTWASSMVFIYYLYLYAFSPEILWLLFGCAGTLCFHVWPRTVYRINEYIDERMPKSWLKQWNLLYDVMKPSQKTTRLDASISAKSHGSTPSRTKSAKSKGSRSGSGRRRPSPRSQEAGTASS